MTHRIDTWVKHHTERYPYGYDNIPDNTNKPGLQSNYDTGQWEHSARNAAVEHAPVADHRRVCRAGADGGRRGAPPARQAVGRCAARRAGSARPRAGHAAALSGATGLTAEPIASVLRDLRAYADVEDALARERIRAREEQVGGRISNAERYELYGAAPPLAIAPHTGELLYALTRARRPRIAVEFGASHGVSTIHLAAGLRDAGIGSLVSSELLPEKADAARRNLVAAGLGDIVELRTGDALETLGDLRGPLDLVFLDGRNDLYLDVLRLLEPQLAPGALVLADLSDDPDLDPYLAYTRAAFTSLTLLGLEISLL